MYVPSSHLFLASEVWTTNIDLGADAVLKQARRPRRGRRIEEGAARRAISDRCTRTHDARAHDARARVVVVVPRARFALHDV